MAGRINGNKPMSKDLTRYIEVQRAKRNEYQRAYVRRRRKDPKYKAKLREYAVALYRRKAVEDPEYLARKAAAMKRWRLANPEKWRAINLRANRKWRLAHSEEDAKARRRANKIWRERNPERARELARAAQLRNYAKKHPEVLAKRLEKETRPQRGDATIAKMRAALRPQIREEDVDET